MGTFAASAVIRDQVVPSSRGPGPPGARVIADHVHRPETVDRGSRQGSHRRFVANIGGHRERLGAQARDLLRVGQHHVKPGAPQAPP